MLRNTNGKYNLDNYKLFQVIITDVPVKLIRLKTIHEESNNVIGYQRGNQYCVYVYHEQLIWPIYQFASIYLISLWGN